MRTYYAIYAAITIHFLRKFLGKVLVPHSGRPDLSTADSGDIIIYAIPAGTADNLSEDSGL